MSCVTASRCTAVGRSSDGITGATLIEQWDGSAWKIVASPNPVGAIDSQLAGVSCAAANRCTAVGRSSDGLTTTTLIAQWHGGAWTILPSPNPSGAQYSSLFGVSCTAAVVCTAVGSTTTGVTTTTLVERWTVAKPTLVTSPNPVGAGYSQLLGVSCPSPASCTAVGNTINGPAETTLVERWDGSSWIVVPSPNPLGSTFSVLFSVSCASTTGCTAVGNGGNLLGDMTLVERWDGSSWVVVPSPNPSRAIAFSELSAVSCPAARACLAVGSWSDGLIATPLVEQWDGSSWVVASPNPGGVLGAARLTGVSCRAVSACTAVGDAFTLPLGTTLVEAL